MPANTAPSFSFQARGNNPHRYWQSLRARHPKASSLRNAAAPELPSVPYPYVSPIGEADSDAYCPLCVPEGFPEG